MKCYKCREIINEGSGLYDEKINIGICNGCLEKLSRNARCILCNRMIDEKSNFIIFSENDQLKKGFVCENCRLPSAAET